MRSFYTLALLVGFGLCAHAQEQRPPALMITPSGYYFVVLNDDGEPTLVKIQEVVHVGGSPPPAPDPGDPVPPAPDVETKVRGWTQEVNHPTGAQVLALVYLTIADQMKAGNLSYADGPKAIGAGSDQALKLVGGLEKWATWRGRVTELLTAEMQAGRVRDAAGLEAFLRSVGKALTASGAEAPAMDPELLRLIVQIIMQLIMQFIGGGGGGDVVTPLPAPSPL